MTGSADVTQAVPFQMCGLVEEDYREFKSYMDTADYRHAAGMCARLFGAAIGRLSMVMLSNQAEAEEAVQETLMSAYQSLTGYRGEGTLRAWLFAIARRVCARRLALRGKIERNLHLIFDRDDAAPDSEELMLTRMRAHGVRTRLQDLKPSEREAVVMRFHSGLEYHEIALACGIDEATVRKRVSRGLRSLRELLERDPLFKDGDGSSSNKGGF